MLEGFSRGIVKSPLAILIYGVEGIGKSWFAADFPEPVFFGLEKGIKNRDVWRAPSQKTWADLIREMNRVLKEKHNWKTAVFDSLDWMEPLIIQETCRRAGESDIDSGKLAYGKGGHKALIVWKEFIQLAERLRDERDMNLVFIAHAQQKKQSDAHHQREYYRHSIKIHQLAADYFKEYVDAVLFCNYLSFVEEHVPKQYRAVGEGIPKMYTQRRPGFDAKNRLGLPAVLDLQYSDFIAAVEKGQPESLEEVMARIQSYKDELKEDPNLIGLIDDEIKKSGTNVRRLTQIASRLALKLTTPKEGSPEL